jgi:hypothetical protein
MENLAEDVRHHIARVIDDAIERAADHIAWLGQNPNEPDHDQQIAECERAIELAVKAQALFPPPEISLPPETTEPRQPGA